ncbi:peroxide stress protein YaaA [Tropicimonas sp.]|uniref:peroxide stress protein YaaA n=1 Tax=Tropicimonas sp. TaxID=2067044 RepID=UPI003A869253
MLVVLSPAKRLDWSDVPGMAMTGPHFTADAARLAAIVRKLTIADLKRLMGLSDALARLNRQRFADFSDPPAPGALRPAIRAFAGDTYAGFEAASLDREELDRAQDHLRILSGLYGVLRPYDAIQPYRLEMGTRLKTPAGANLYDYWADRPARALATAVSACGAGVLVNCASREYFAAVDTRALGLRVVAPVFLENRPGGPKIVSFFAKKARGAMARFIVANRLRDPQALRDFDTGGYRYQPALSSPDSPVFLRGEPDGGAA